MSALCKINEAQLYLELMLSCSRAFAGADLEVYMLFYLFYPFIGSLKQPDVSELMSNLT